jgi:FAD synthase
MNQTALNFNPYPENIFTPGTMNHRLYERLKEGPVLLSELHREMGMDTARIRDVRNLLLKKYGFNIACRIIREGETEYRVV